MIHILNSILKIIGQIIMSVIGFCCILLAILFWKGKYMDVASDLQKEIWKN